MKKVVVILLLLLTARIMWGQYYQLPEKSYFVTIYNSTTGSGHGMMFNYSIGTETEKRSLELGAVLDVNNMVFTGSEVLYKRFNKPRRMKAPDLSMQNTPFRFYFLYNFVIHRTDQIRNFDSRQYYTGVSTKDNKVTTIEHYIGFGIQYMLFGKFQLDSNMGGGVYLGSIYAKGLTPPTFGIHKNNYGFVLSAKIGMAYVF